MLFIPRFVIVGGVALLSLPTFAGAPAPFDNWAANNGNVAAGCGGANSGLNCAVLNAGPGFLQQQVRDPTTKLTYIQTIVTNPLASGTATSQPFSSENFVRTGNFDSTLSTGQTIPTRPQQTSPQLAVGIASQQRLHAESSTATATGVFDTVVLINSGWAAMAGTPNINITQTVSEIRSDGVKFASNVQILGNNDDAGLQTGTRIRLDSSFSDDDKDVQVFHMRRAGGNMLTVAGRATLPNNTSVAWNAGDVAQTVWVGQQFDVGSRASGTLGFQSYDNLSDAVDHINYLSTSTPGPFTWFDPPFGASPAMPDGDIGDGR